jgi:hypothetical protein
VDGQQPCYWLLPKQKLPAELDPHGDTEEVDRWLAELAEKYPPPTPLDEEEDGDY